MNETDVEPSQDKGGRRRWGLYAAIFVALGMILLILYETLGPTGKVSASICPEGAKKWQALDPLVHGEIAALALAREPKPLPELSFTGPDGQPKTLADFRGRTLLVNLWATWCVPCRQEMPALDRLEAAMGSKDFEVVAINIDTTKLDRPKAFLDEIKVKNLNFYANPTTSVFQSLKQAGKAQGLPTTVLIDRQGCEIGTMAGSAEWDSPEALALLKAAQT